MPLPANDTPWPPPGYAAAHDKMAEHDAWYSGDIGRLASTYARRNERPATRPSQLRGGLVGTVARFWWGKPVPPGEEPNRLHVPLAGDMATVSADLLFGEPPRIVIDSGVAGVPSPAQARLEDVLAPMDSLMNESGEVAAALGGVYLRAGWDTTVSDKPLVDTIHPDNAYPTFRRGRLEQLLTVNVLVRDGVRVWRHVEVYERGAHLHGLYIGTEENLGTQVALSGHPETAGYEAAVVIPGNLLPVAYVPNMRPNRLDRASQLGRSDYSGSEGVLDRLDEVWSSWIRDIRLAKGRLIVASEYLESAGPGQGAGFDVDREVYETLNIPPLSAAGGAAITPSQFAIRVQEHSDTCRALVEEVIRAAGYSAGTFGLDQEGVAVTATEVTAKERRSFTTRRKKIAYWRPGLREVAALVCAIDAAVFGQAAVDPNTIKVEWPDGVSDGLLTLAQTALALRQAEAASDETLVRLVHPDWDKDQVDAEVAALGDARQALMPPDPLAGLPA